MLSSLSYTLVATSWPLWLTILIHENWLLPCSRITGAFPSFAKLIVSLISSLIIAESNDAASNWIVGVSVTVDGAAEAGTPIKAQAATSDAIKW